MGNPDLSSAAQLPIREQIEALIGMDPEDDDGRPLDPDVVT